MERIDHPIPPLYDGSSRILILGSFPSVKSREAMFFYGHPQNRFWPVLAAVLGCERPTTIEEKKRLALTHHIDLLQRRHVEPVFPPLSAATDRPRGRQAPLDQPGQRRLERRAPDRRLARDPGGAEIDRKGPRPAICGCGGVFQSARRPAMSSAEMR